MRKMIQQYAKDLTAGRLASGYEHSFRVYHLTREIGEGLDYDDDILHAACFLHDVEMSVGHPASSADKAEAILHETGFVPDKIPPRHRGHPQPHAQRQARFGRGASSCSTPTCSTRSARWGSRASPWAGSSGTTIKTMQRNRRHLAASCPSPTGSTSPRAASSRRRRSPSPGRPSSSSTRAAPLGSRACHPSRAGSRDGAPHRLGPADPDAEPRRRGRRRLRGRVVRHGPHPGRRCPSIELDVRADTAAALEALAARLVDLGRCGTGRRARRASSPRPPTPAFPTSSTPPPTGAPTCSSTAPWREVADMRMDGVIVAGPGGPALPAHPRVRPRRPRGLHQPGRPHPADLPRVRGRGVRLHGERRLVGAQRRGCRAPRRPTSWYASGGAAAG